MERKDDGDWRKAQKGQKNLRFPPINLGGKFVFGFGDKCASF